MIFLSRRDLHTRQIAIFVALLIFSACGAAPEGSSGSSSAGAEAPSPFTWDQVCAASASRIDRCPSEIKADGAFSRRCAAAENDRACFDTFNAGTARFLMSCIENTACGGSESIFNRCAAKLFTDVPLDGPDTQRQESCRAHMTECRLSFQERCIAPFLKEPLRTQVWACVEKPCADVRRCAEAVLEPLGCR